MKTQSKFWYYFCLFSAIDLLIVSILKFLIGIQNYGQILIAFYMAILFVVQIIAGVIINHKEKQPVYGKALLLSTLVLALVGFGVCTINP